MKHARYAFLLACFCVGAVPAQARTIRVTVENLAFSPARIEADAGDVIEWDNKDVIRHTVTVKGGFDIVLPPRTVTRQELKTALNTGYYCRYHPGMTGHLTVRR